MWEKIHGPQLTSFTKISEKNSLLKPEYERILEIFNYTSALLVEWPEWMASL